MRSNGVAYPVALRAPLLLLLMVAYASIKADAAELSGAPKLQELAKTGAPKTDAPVTRAVVLVQPPQSTTYQSPAGVATDDGIRLLFRSFESAAISSEINARITYLPAREGDRIHKGGVLIQFDCSRIAAEHEAAVAAYDAHRISFESQVKMFRYKAAGALAVEQARFEMKKAQADAAGLQVRRGGCVIRAPFDGRVSEKIAQIHEIAQPNQPLIRIVNDSKLEMVLMAPSAWLPGFVAGMNFNVKVDETGETHRARIVQSTGLIDPVSQSARLIGEFVNPAPGVLPGMSGTAFLARSGASKW